MMEREDRDVNEEENNKHQVAGADKGGDGIIIKRCIANINDGQDNEMTHQEHEGELEEQESLEWRKRVSLLLSGSDHSTETLRQLPLPPPPTCVRHIAQLSHWDCGIACLLMVLDWLGLTTSSSALLLEEDRQELADSLGTQSVWTADLVMQLQLRLHQQQSSSSIATTNHRSRGCYLFCSQTLHVNDDLGELAYYQKAFASDRNRVQGIFETIRTQNLPVVQRSNLRLEEIVHLVQRPDCIAIVLVDNSILRRAYRRQPRQQQLLPVPVEGHEEGLTTITASPTITTTDERACDASGACSACGSSAVYMGHYLVITGIVPNDDDKDTTTTTTETNNSDQEDEVEEPWKPYMFQVHNPALDFGNVLVNPSLLDKARGAPGTDQDIIFVVKH